MYHIFISYSHQDTEFALVLMQKLKLAGYEAWLDSEKLRAGEDWRKSIDDGIRRSFVLIVIMSPSAKLSEYVTYEWAFALGIGVAVLPIVYKSTPVHPRLEVLQYLDFTKAKSKPWKELLKNIDEFQRAHLLNRTLRIRIIEDKSQSEGEGYFVDDRGTIRKIPDYDTLTFLENIVGTENIPQAALSQIVGNLGEPLVPIGDWRNKRPQTPSEEAYWKVANVLRLDWYLKNDTTFTGIICTLYNKGKETLFVKSVSLIPISTITVLEFDSSYIRNNSELVIVDNLNSFEIPPESEYTLGIRLKKPWIPKDAAEKKGLYLYLNPYLISDSLLINVLLGISYPTYKDLNPEFPEF